MDIFKKKGTGDSGEQSDILERELTNKFISGELSFAEYTQQWNNSTLVEDDGGSDCEDGAQGEASTGETRQRREDERTESRIRRVLRRQLPPALLGLMGEANLRYARGEKELAEKMCYEIIRQVPTASEPFHTLAQIHEGNAEKSFHFSLIAAHLNPLDSEQWLRLAAISRERGDYRQEVLCYTRAINASPKNISYHMKRLQVLQGLESMGVPLHSLNLTPQQCYLRLLGILPPSDGANILNIAKSVARHYHADNKIDKALRAMNMAYKKCSDLFSLEDVNLYLELLISQKVYNKCLDVLVAKGGVEIEAEVQTVENEGGEVEDITQVISCTIPSSLPIDLRSKLAVCLIHMRAFHLIDFLFEAVLVNEDAEVAGDIFLDIEEALTSEGRYEEALKLLKLLVASSRFSLPAVWLKYAECLMALQRVEEAIQPYQTVISLAPQHLEARMKLANILKEKERYNEALIALAQNEKTDVLDSNLLYESCKIYKTIGDLNGYLYTGDLLLSKYFHKIRIREEIRAFKTKDTAEVLRVLREARGEEMEEPDGVVFDEGSNSLSLAEEWDLLFDLIKTSHDLKNYVVMERMSLTALGSKRFSPYRNILELLSLLGCIYNGDYFYAFILIKDFIFKSPEKPKLWNILNLIIQKVDYTRYNKFIQRFLMRLGWSDRNLFLMHANNSLIAGSYKFALKEYMTSYKELKSPLTAMLIGITMIHIASQRFTVNKHILVMQGIGILSYYEKLRGEDGQQEVWYNIGRAYHQLGLMHKACQYYKKALGVQNALINSNPQVLDLSKEIAYNLHLIYKNDCPELAKMYLEKYLVI